MNEKIQRIKKHLYDNRKEYLIGAGCLVAGIVIGGVTIFVLKRSIGNKTIIDSFNLIKYKSPHTSQLIQILSPGNSGNVIQDLGSGIIYPSQNAAVKALDLNKSNLTQHLQGMLPNANGHIFKKIIDGSAPHEFVGDITKSVEKLA